MQRLFIVAISLSLSLGASHSAALAQETSETLTAANGDAAALGTGNATSAPGTITRDGVSSVSGPSLLGPDGTYRVTEVSPPTVNAPSDTVVEIVPAAERAPIAEAPEEEIGADSTAPDTDGDWVTDSDEIDVYGTDPNSWDTDGDNLSDGDELYVVGTDPLVWDTNGDGISDGGVEAVAETGPLVADEGAPLAGEESASGATGVDSDADRLADTDEATAGTDPANPDTDGDGYYDGDEVILGTDPFDPVSFPAG